jgi:hypothetical protein
MVGFGHSAWFDAVFGIAAMLWGKAFNTRIPDKGIYHTAMKKGGDLNPRLFSWLY